AVGDGGVAGVHEAGRAAPRRVVVGQGRGIGQGGQGRVGEKVVAVGPDALQPQLRRARVHPFVVIGIMAEAVARRQQLIEPRPRAEQEQRQEQPASQQGGTAGKRWAWGWWVGRRDDISQWFLLEQKE